MSSLRIARTPHGHGASRPVVVVVLAALLVLTAPHFVGDAHGEPSAGDNRTGETTSPCPDKAVNVNRTGEVPTPKPPCDHHPTPTTEPTATATPIPTTTPIVAPTSGVAEPTPTSPPTPTPTEEVVVLPPPTTPTPAPVTLARTGPSSTTGAAVIGVTAIAAGLVLLYSRRRSGHTTW